jgi:gamma-glutamyl hydrolase
MRARLALAAAAAAAAGAAAQDPVNVQTAPVIGILSVPINATTEPCITSAEDRARFGGEAASCFTSFYAKFVESAGGRAVVIPYNANTTILDRLFNAVNGILFTGGGADLYLDTPFVRAGKYLFDKVVAAAAGPDPVALHATCMGFQMVRASVGVR